METSPQVRPVTTGKIPASLAAALLLVALPAGCARDEPAEEIELLKGISADYLLTPVQASGLPAPLGQEFAVTESGGILLRAGADLLEAEPAGKKLQVELFAKAGLAPDSFALVGGVVLTIHGQYFGQLEDGTPTKALPLPAKGMQLSPSCLSGVVYLHGGPASTSQRAYALKDTGAFTILAELPAPIVAVADSPGSIYLATTMEILRLRNDRIDLVLRLPAGEGPIASLAVSDDDQTVFYATPHGVYALHGAIAMRIVGKSTGTLRWQADALYLWDQSRSLLVRMNHLSSALYPRVP